MKSMKIGLIASALGLLLTSGCGIKMGGMAPIIIGGDYDTVTQSQNLNFTEAGPVYHIYKVELGLDFAAQGQLNKLSLKNVPGHYLKVKYQGETKQAGGSAAIYVASKKEMSAEDLLALSVKSISSRSNETTSSVSFNGDNKSLPLCEGMVTGLIFQSEKLKGQDKTTTMRVNIGNNNQQRCALMGRVVAPDKGRFELDINGEKVITSKMSPNERAHGVLSWTVKNTDPSRSRLFGLSFGAEKFIEAL